ncbi:MAG: AGE family epimerase/isomerase [Bacteroidia bacterium]|nr:AGE family epimerase/isomerase [Bacteroidia bacterium]
MSQLELLKELSSAWKAELSELLDWWIQNMVDEEHGGFRGEIDQNGKIVPETGKSIILNTRILWSFSHAARFTEKSEYKEIADRAFTYLTNHYIDKVSRGLVWMLDPKGYPVDGKKQIYAQAFGIYAFSEYFLLTGDLEAKELAYELFNLIEIHSKDEFRNGYHEAFSHDWGKLEDLRLGDKDANEPKTMNTHLHILEAYTNLYRLDQHRNVGLALANLLHLFIDKFLDKESGHLGLFFDENWNLKSDSISYGHDIEASWLIWEALEVIEDENLKKEMLPFVLKMAINTLNEGVEADGALINELEPPSNYDRDRIWWVQVEAMVGAMNAYEVTSEKSLLNYVEGLWKYIEGNLKDTEFGEWHWGRTTEGKIMPNREKAGPWKAPYHIIRALIECISRSAKLLAMEGITA